MEEIKKIEVQGTQYGVADMLMRSVMGDTTQVIEWSHTHNMNDYKDAGTYRIKGERTGNPLSDNLPIMNQGSGHTIEGILYVLDSSLTNGSGKQDDCTITQFLMLSNRVGGQEGDMYMRSAYGANKDSLVWKPWEKYQTNMEVGCVSDYFLHNPSNPTEVIKQNSGMWNLTDNGIYSGVYLPQKALLGTYAGAEIKDPTAIETFVMVVINNYAAAGDNRCVTQIKFAVTNGGVFSMEKRSVIPENSYPQWESVGGSGGSNSLINKPNTSDSSSLIIGDDAVNLKFSNGGDWDITAKGESLEFKNNKRSLQAIISNKGLTIGSDAGGSGGIVIGNNVKIADGVNITNKGMSTPYYRYVIYFPTIDEDWNISDSSIRLGADSVSGAYYRLVPDGNNAYSYFSVGVANRETGEGFRAGGSECWDLEDGSYVDRQYQMYLTKDNIRFRLYDDWEETEKWTQLPYGLTIEPSEDGSKLLFSYNGKTAELPLT